MCYFLLDVCHPGSTENWVGGMMFEVACGLLAASCVEVVCGLFVA